MGLCRRRLVVSSLSSAPLLLLLLGCFLSASESTHPTTGGPPATFTVRNQSEHEICYVNMWPAADTMWNGDWLAPAETIPTGRARTFEMTAGVWHIRMQDCQHQMLFDRSPVTIEGAIELDFRVVEAP